MKPILFSTPMVQAIKNDRKSMTRRVCKDSFKTVYSAACSHGKWNESYKDMIPDHVIDWYIKEIAQPRYKVGDVLWVRETWCATEPHFGKGTEPKYYYRADQTPESERCRKDFGIP